MYFKKMFSRLNSNPLKEVFFLKKKKKRIDLEDPSSITLHSPHWLKMQRISKMQRWFPLSPWDLVYICVKEGIYLQAWYIPISMRKNPTFINCINVNDLYINDNKVNDHKYL